MIKLNKEKLANLENRLDEVNKKLIGGEITDENIRERNNLMTYIQTMIQNDMYHSSNKNKDTYIDSVVVLNSNYRNNESIY